eukprot:tig00000989_g6099.t1
MGKKPELEAAPRRRAGFPFLSLLLRPDRDAVLSYLDARGGDPLSYAADGHHLIAPGTRGVRPRNGYSPNGFRVVVGRGSHTFEVARDFVKDFQMVARATKNPLLYAELWPPGALTQREAPLAVVARVYGVLWSVSPCRLLYAQESDGGGSRTFALSYGTLTDHLISGEERFRVTHEKGSDLVEFEVASLSQPNERRWGPLGRAAGVFVKPLQRIFVRETARAVFEHCRRAEGDYRLRGAPGVPRFPRFWEPGLPVLQGALGPAPPGPAAGPSRREKEPAAKREAPSNRDPEPDASPPKKAPAAAKRGAAARKEEAEGTRKEPPAGAAPKKGAAPPPAPSTSASAPAKGEASPKAAAPAGRPAGSAAPPAPAPRPKKAAPAPAAKSGPPAPAAPTAAAAAPPKAPSPPSPPSGSSPPK